MGRRDRRKKKGYILREIKRGSSLPMAGVLEG
jgi:hypothetical protein